MMSLQLSSDALDDIQAPLGAIDVFAEIEDAFDEMMLSALWCTPLYAAHAANALTRARGHHLG